MSITRIHVWDFTPAFRDGPYVMSHVTQACAYGRILAVQTTDGVLGVGEIVFAPSLSAQERRRRIVDERQYLPALIGREVDALMVVARDVRGLGKSWSGVCFGMETAYFDICARRQKRSVADLLGGPLAESVDDYFSISERTVARVEERLAIAGPERTVIQLKLGIGRPDEEAVQIEAALGSVNRGQTLLADANGGWSVDEACEMAARFDDPRLIWEEPCRTYDDNVAVTARSNKPVMLDQCTADLAAARRAIEEQAAAAMCIKPAFLGGLRAAREVRDRCAEAGMRMRIDGPWCGDIATAAILNLAVGAPRDLLIAGCDLREPLAIEPGLGGVVARGPCRIAPLPGPGLGIERVRERLGEPERVYQ